MRDKSGNETEPPLSTPPTYSVRCVSLALSPLGYDFRCRAARCDSQWDDESFKPAIGGFRDYSCGTDRRPSSFRFLSVSRVSRLSRQYNASRVKESGYIQASISREMNLDFELNDIFNFSRTHFYNVDVRTLDFQ